MKVEQKPYVVLAAVSLQHMNELALREAASAAQLHSSSELHVVHVVESDGEESQTDTLRVHGMLAEARQQLRSRVEALQSVAAMRVSGHIRPGVPVKGILQVAAEIGADLIVVGSRKRTALAGLRLESIARRLLRDADCAVLVARRKNYPRLIDVNAVEPTCPECLAVRATSQAARWCERHSRPPSKPHRYEPSDVRRGPALT